MSEAKEEPKPPEPPKEKSSKLLPALVGFNSLLLVGVMVFLGLQMKGAAAAQHAPAAEAHDAPAEEGHEKAEPAEKEAKEEKEAKGEKKAEAEEKKEEGKEGKEGAPKHAVAGLGPLVKISDFVIHLRNPEIDRYARMSFDVEVIAESDKDALNAHMPRVRDAFISYLSDRTLEEMQGAVGLGRTKDALQTKMRDLVPEARVRNLYISDFVVQ